VRRRNKLRLTIHSNLSLILKITLVGHDDDRERVLVLDAKNLLVERADLLERIAGGDGVNEEETFTGAHVLLAHSSAWSEWQGRPQ
jgi:hypothetical protein